MIGADRIQPDSPLRGAVARAVMLRAAARLAGDSHPPRAALAGALRRTALGRFDAAEWAWIDRIEAQRRHAESGPADSLRAAVPHWSIPRIWGRLLFCLVRDLRPTSCIELGIGFGVSACYQTAALELNGAGRLIALDREDELVEIARENLTELGLSDRVEIRMGAIGTTLEDAAAAAAPIHLGYIDAEHTEEATIANFEGLLPHLAAGAVVIADDIAVDDGMGRAWARIRRHERVDDELAMRRVGIVIAGSR